MPEPLRITFARWCRETRIDLDITQQVLAESVGVSRSLIAMYETGHAVPDLEMVDRIGTVLGVRFTLSGHKPVILGPRRERDTLHARCSGYADRRMRGLGLLTAREVEVMDRRTHGWIDLLAFDARTGTVIIVEIKTGLDDVGATERQLGWYERLVSGPIRELGWPVRSVVSWLLVLASDEVDQAVARQRDALGLAFPVRAPQMRAILGGGTAPSGRGLALIDPARRRRDWLLPSRIDGRRTAAPYRDRADALVRLAGPSAGLTLPGGLTSGA
jgi:transcriptional regulator with XRE-family HTH domain